MIDDVGARKQEVLNYIDAQFQDHLMLWKQICTMETPSDDRDALNRQADFIAAFCSDRGFKVERQQHPHAGDTLLIETKGTADRRPVALLAHMDTVHPKGAFGAEPVAEREGILYGPGVFDCKGGIVAALLAMDALRAGRLPHGAIRLILNSDEENGAYIGADGPRFIEQAASGCCAALNCEAGRRGSLVVGRKGVARVLITVNGTAAHAGNAYFSGISAIKEAAHKIIALEKSSSGEGITVNCGVIHGGTTANCVPDRCCIEVDLRFRNHAQEEQGMELIREVVQTSYLCGSASSFAVLSRRPAMERTPENQALFDVVARAAEEIGLETVTPVERGGASDSAYTVDIGVPTVCAMGPTGRFEHTPQEEADIASLGARAKLLAMSIAAV